jgi:hypothetical protein
MAGLIQNLNRAFVLIALTPASEISLVDSYNKTLSKCCIEPLSPPFFLGSVIAVARFSRGERFP